MGAIRRFMIRGWRVIFWVGPSVMVVCAAMTYWHAQQALSRHNDDDDLAFGAQRIAQAADVYIGRIVNGIWDIAAAPSLRVVVSANNKVRSDTAADQEFDKYWRKDKPFDRVEEERIKTLLNSETSRFFQNIVQTPGSVLKEFALADRHGRLVAASVRTDDYLQNDDDWWPKNMEGFRSCRAAPAECALYRDVRWDESANAFGMDVILPVRHNDELAGVLKVVVDPLELDAIASLSDRPVVVDLRRRDGRHLLERGTRTIFDRGDINRPDQETAQVGALPSGGETILRRRDGDIAVRALRGPMGRHWIAAARPADDPEGTSWVVPAGWLVLTVAALLVTAFAAAIREGRADDPMPAQQIVETA